MRKLLIALAAITLFASCGEPKETQQRTQQKAKGPVMYGGVFRLNEVEDFRNLYPLNVTEVTSFRIANQVYEGLVKFSSKDLSIIPSLAERWEINEEATKFTFFIRKGVMFHDDPCFPEGKGREVTADDFLYSFTNLCTSSSENQMFGLLFDKKVKGASEYYQSTIDGAPLADGVSGIKIIDKYTIQLELENSFAGFLNIVGHNGCWVIPKEAVEEYGIDMRIKCVGTGAFTVKKVKEGEAVILAKNPNYWKFDEFGNQLPYLDAIRFSFLKEKKAELLEFKKGNLDMVFQLPLEMIDEVVGELEDAKLGGNKPFQMQVNSAFSVQYYGFQNKSELFSNKDVRKAFNYAIDREKLVTYTLQGDGTPGIYGIVPPGLKGYEYDSLRGYSYDPEKAMDYFAKAGYPNGEGFPEITLQLNSGGSRNIQLAEAIQSMLMETLNISIKMNVMPFAQHLEALETGKTLFWRSAWLADYPDPENFLSLLYGPLVPEKLEEKSYINSVRYQSEAYDTIFEKALATVDKSERFKYYRMADQIALDDAPYMPICYDEFTRLLQRNVRNFPANAMEYRDFSTVFFKD
ncbi:MAG: ABC transporter substrate-binding protein [Flavobacteriales bacterium]|nr:ABC transporter substrate-binding protein [Flavobacteriales bacterium]